MPPLLTLPWKITTHVKIHMYQEKHLPLFTPSYYTVPDINNRFGYGKIIKPRTEIIMHRDCIAVMRELNWQLVAHEWPVSPEHTHLGQGDLVFQSNCCTNDFLIMEVKRRNSKYVYAQSQFYASAWKLRYAPQVASRVYFGVWTSYKQEIIGLIHDTDEAKRLCNRRTCIEL
jgi:hypothetical protein